MSEAKRIHLRTLDGTTWLFRAVIAAHVCSLYNTFCSFIHPYSRIACMDLDSSPMYQCIQMLCSLFFHCYFTIVIIVITIMNDTKCVMPTDSQIRILCLWIFVVFLITSTEFTASFAQSISIHWNFLWQQMEQFHTSISA